MRHRHPRSTLVAAAGLALMVAACTISGSDPADTTALSAPIVEQTTTTAASATPTTAPTTTVAPTTTMSAWDALPPHVKAADWVMATYESIGYSCEGAGNPDMECDAPHRVEYTRPLIGSEHGADFFDFLGSYDPEAEPFPADSPYSDWSLTGSVADYPLAGFGHGIRMQQLDRAPPGLDIGGEAWIRLTISSLSASDYAEATGELVPTDLGYRIETGSDGDPIYMRSPAVFPRTQWIESVVLVATNDTMSQWVIAFNQPGTYTSTASYWTGMAEDYALNIRFVRL